MSKLTTMDVVSTGVGLALNPAGEVAEQGRNLGRFVGEEVYYARNGVSETFESVLERSKYGYAASQMNTAEPSLLKRAFAPTSPDGDQKSDFEMGLDTADAAIGLAQGNYRPAAEMAVDELSNQLEGQAIEGLAAATGSALLAYGVVEGTKAGVTEYMDIGQRHEATLLAVAGEMRTYDRATEGGVIRGETVDYNGLGASIPGITVGAVTLEGEQYLMVLDATEFADGGDQYYMYVINEQGQFVNINEFDERLVELQNSDDIETASLAADIDLIKNKLAVDAISELTPFADEMRTDIAGTGLAESIDKQAYQDHVDAVLDEKALGIGDAAAGINARFADPQELTQAELDIATRPATAPTAEADTVSTPPPSGPTM